MALSFLYTYVCLFIFTKFVKANEGEMRDASLIPELGRSPGVGMATLSSSLTWKVPWTGSLVSKESQRVGHNWVNERIHHTAIEIPYLLKN